MNIIANFSDTKNNGNNTTLNSDNASNLHFVFFITIPGILLNGFLLVLLYRCKNAQWVRNTMNIVCNIVSDFMISILNTFLALTFSNKSGQWPIEMCYAKIYFGFTLQCISLNHILTLCIDRFRAAIRIRNNQVSVSLSRPYKRSAVIWICTSFFSLLTFLPLIKEDQARKLGCLSDPSDLRLNLKLFYMFRAIMISVPWLISNILFIITSIILYRKMKIIQVEHYPLQHAESSMDMHSCKTKTDDLSTVDNTKSYRTYSEIACSKRDINDSQDRSLESKNNVKSSIAGDTEISHHFSCMPSTSKHIDGVMIIRNFEMSEELVLQVDKKINSNNLRKENLQKQSNSQESKKDACQMKTNKPEDRPVEHILGKNGNLQQRYCMKQAMITLLLLLAVFNISTWPMFVRLIDFQLSEPFELDEKFYIFVFMNQTLNPIIYAIRISHIRNAIKELVRSYFHHH